MQNTEFACEVTLQPLRRYDLDAAILFSDILTIPDALGLGLYFETGEGPKFHKTVRTEQDVANLPKLNAKSDLDYVMNAVSTIRSALGGQVPLIGFRVALGHWRLIWLKVVQAKSSVLPSK